MSESTAPVLHGEIESPRPLRAPGGKVSLAGWCLAEGVPSAPTVRLVTAAGTLPMTSRCARRDVPLLLPGEPAAADCGFTLEGRLPAGVHVACFEARLPGGRWQVFKQLVLAVESVPFLAALDEPLSEGTLRDRVKVGGWALDPSGPVAELALRYGHREISCRLAQPRPDVGAAYSGVPHAAQSGFISGDFLVAGHGPVRIKARLADGRTLIAPTRVVFSIATDENHQPELDLTAPRIGLEPIAPPRLEEGTPTRGDRPLNLLFILPGSFAANHAFHVSGLANSLATAGHDCAVAVTHDLATLSHHERPAFRGLLHSEAAGVTYANGRGPDLIHAWTTRENVRRLSEQLRAKHGARLIVHLEDNEQQILALTLGRPWSELDALPDAELDRLVPADLSHPHRSRTFLASADGVTVITERLREFVPAGLRCHLFWPAADARYFFPHPRPDAFRQVLDIRPGTTVLFYHGNVHAANAAEVRDLYAAVLELNQSGHPVTLIRAGLDAVDFLGNLAGPVAPHVLSLGQILRHRHLAPLLALADIYVQPGGTDAFNDYRFPSKLPEFFALGRPVILPRTNLGSLVRHGIDAYVLEQADAASIAGAVRALRGDPALAERLGRGAAAFAAEHFSWRRSAEGLAKFYLSLAPS
ncbi:MAG: glycosyltransferase family 4 protein [Opitutales bacterium]